MISLGSEDKNLKAWLSQKQLTHSIGAFYNGKIDQWMVPEVPIDSYDGFIFIKKTSVSILIVISMVGMSIYKNRKNKSNI